MKRETQLVIIGVCYATLLTQAMDALVKNSPQDFSLRMARTFPLFLAFFGPLFEEQTYDYSGGDGVVTLRQPWRVPHRCLYNSYFVPNKKHMTREQETAKIRNYYQSKVDTSRATDMPLEIELPLPEDSRKEYVYCWAGLMWSHYVDRLLKNGFEGTQGMLADYFDYLYKPQIDCLSKIKAVGLRVVVMEPNRIFPREERITYYKRLINFERKHIKKCLSQHGIPCVEHPEELIDGDGFTVSQLRRRPDDDAHGSPLFHEIMLKKLEKMIVNGEV